MAHGISVVLHSVYTLPLSSIRRHPRSIQPINESRPSRDLVQHRANCCQDMHEAEKLNRQDFCSTVCCHCPVFSSTCIIFPSTSQPSAVSPNQPSATATDPLGSMAAAVSTTEPLGRSVNPSLTGRPISRSLTQLRCWSCCV